MPELPGAAVLLVRSAVAEHYTNVQFGKRVAGGIMSWKATEL